VTKSFVERFTTADTADTEKIKQEQCKSFVNVSLLFLPYLYSVPAVVKNSPFPLNQSEMLFEERGHLPAVEVYPGLLAARVVAAGKPGHVEL
jgi:hypothetical protein